MTSDSKNHILAIVFSVIILIGWQYFIGSTQPNSALVPLQELVRRHMADIVFQIAFAAAVLITAGSLYALRLLRRRAYAVVEIVSGVAAGIYAANTFYGAIDGNERARAVFATIAGIYVIVRGLDNWREGRKPAKPKPPISSPLVNIISKHDLRPT